MSSNKKTLWLAQISILTAIELLFCFTVLGSLPIAPGIVATLAHIPAIVAALSLGHAAAAVLGAVMGVSSLIVWTFMPPNPVFAFVFSPAYTHGGISSVIISVIPRILFPVITYFIFSALKKKLPLTLSAGISAALGTLAHSAMVLSLIFMFFYGKEGIGKNFIVFTIAWGGVNALMEIAVAAVIAAGIIIPLSKINASKGCQQ